MKNHFAFLTDNKNLSIIAFGVEDLYECSSIDSSLKGLSKFLNQWKKDYRFGFLSYDLKDEILNLNSDKIDKIGFPNIGFFVPKYVVSIDQSSRITYLKGDEDDYSKAYVEVFLSNKELSNELNIELKPKISKEHYLDTVSKIKDDIKNQRIEEINYCQEFYAENIDVSPIQMFFKLNEMAKAPFSCFLKWNNSYLSCTSPERYLKRKGKKIITQPIKGTAKRGQTIEEDERLKQELLNSDKERAENVLTVKAIQLELAKIAKNGQTEITELCRLYSFETVHQLISTIEAEISENVEFTDIIRTLFPMGSMTGVPYKEAVIKIDKYEDFKRGLYSGSVGFIEPNGDFDFNVVIRSVMYNDVERYLNCSVGGAITSQSIPEKEYEECLIKIDPIRQVLSEKR